MEVKAVREIDFDLIKELTSLEEEAFQRGGLNEWTLPVFIRYGRVYVLEERGEIEGVAEFIRDWNDIKRVFLVGFSIRQDKRGRGLGKFFLKKVIELLEGEDVKNIRITVSSDNEVALRLYEKLGFARTDCLIDEYGLGEDRLLMELNLEEGKLK